MPKRYLVRAMVAFVLKEDMPAERRNRFLSEIGGHFEQKLNESFKEWGIADKVRFADEDSASITRLIEVDDEDTYNRIKANLDYGFIADEKDYKALDAQEPKFAFKRHEIG